MKYQVVFYRHFYMFVYGELCSHWYTKHEFLGNDRGSMLLVDLDLTCPLTDEVDTYGVLTEINTDISMRDVFNKIENEYPELFI